MGVYVMTANSTANPTTEQNKPKSKGQGDFFIIDIETWQTIYDDLLNPLNTGYLDDTKATRILASYLVLACGTGGDNVTSRWSATACQKYAGFSVQTGKVAIEYLEQLGHISIAEKKKATSKNNTYKLTKPKQGNEIYIPKSLVMGVNGELTAINRLYLEGNPHLLYLFIRLYAFQYKTLDIIDPNLVSSLIVTYNENTPQPYTQLLYNESGYLNVWGVSNFFTSSAQTNGNFFDFNTNKYLFEHKDEKGVWAFYHKLQSLGLLQTVTYACVGDDYSDPNEIDPICELDTFAQSAYYTWIDILSENKSLQLSTITESYEISHTVVLPKTYQQIHFATFNRLTYRTKLGDNTRFEQEKKINAEIMRLFKNIREMDKDLLARVEKEFKQRNAI